MDTVSCFTLEAPGQMHVEMSVSYSESCALKQILMGVGREGRQQGHIPLDWKEAGLGPHGALSSRKSPTVVPTYYGMHAGGGGT